MSANAGRRSAGLDCRSIMTISHVSSPLTNTAPMPVTITIDAPIVGNGTVSMEVPTGEMKLQLISPALRGGSL